MASAAHSVPGTDGVSARESPTEHMEYAQSSRRKSLASSLEQKIKFLEKQRNELLEVNQQWDRQFRSMKNSYERKVAELRTKLHMAEGQLSTREQERLRRECPWREEEMKSLTKELQELKKENTLLKERNALSNKKKEHYEREIKRLNKALLDVLRVESSSFPEGCLGTCPAESANSEMRTEVEVLRQQVQIYEEDFKKERSDRERLSQEKEKLQQVNQTSQSRLNRLSAQIKACQMEKENLEKQLKKKCVPTCNCDLEFRLRDPWAPTGPGAVQGLQEHPPDYQCYAPDTLPPDVQREAVGNQRPTTSNACVKPPAASTPDATL